jgi:hypothetical protein
VRISHQNANRYTAVHEAALAQKQTSPTSGANVRFRGVKRTSINSFWRGINEFNRIAEARLDVQNLIREIGLIVDHDELANEAFHEIEPEMAEANAEAANATKLPDQATKPIEELSAPISSPSIAVD